MPLVVNSQMLSEFAAQTRAEVDAEFCSRQRELWGLLAVAYNKKEKISVNHKS